MLARKVLDGGSLLHVLKYVVPPGEDVITDLSNILPT